MGKTTAFCCRLVHSKCSSALQVPLTLVCKGWLVFASMREHDVQALVCLDCGMLHPVPRAHSEDTPMISLSPLLVSTLKILLRFLYFLFLLLSLEDSPTISLSLLPHCRLPRLLPQRLHADQSRDRGAHEPTAAVLTDVCKLRAGPGSVHHRR